MDFFASISPVPLLGLPVPVRDCPQLDLAQVPAPWDLSERPQLFAYIAPRLAASPHGVLWGGYLEQRRVYAASPAFIRDGDPRNIHLGVDLWAVAGTPIRTPLDATVYAFADNTGFSNYGPTVILRHEVHGKWFFTLYGHLSRASLAGLVPGLPLSAGTEFCALGGPEENGEWPPHLHFQVIRELDQRSGDYPGVCTASELEWYRENCPDPGVFLG